MNLGVFGIPLIWNSVCFLIFRIVYGIALNSIELREIPYTKFVEFRDFWCNEIPHKLNLRVLIL
jgi:hypothetical protein